jgi:hypothetical protein
VSSAVSCCQRTESRTVRVGQDGTAQPTRDRFRPVARFRDRVAIVTGAGAPGGIGAAVVRRLVAEGGRVVMGATSERASAGRRTRRRGCRGDRRPDRRRGGRQSGARRAGPVGPPHPPLTRRQRHPASVCRLRLQHVCLRRMSVLTSAPGSQATPPRDVSSIPLHPIAASVLGIGLLSSSTG